jgi:hypothetical protein
MLQVPTNGNGTRTLYPDTVLNLDQWTSEPGLYFKLYISPGQFSVLEHFSVAYPECLFRIPDAGYKRSRIRICIKEFKYFNPKNCFLSSRKCNTGCKSRISDPDFISSRIPDPGVKKKPWFPDTDPLHRNIYSLSSGA